MTYSNALLDTPRNAGSCMRRHRHTCATVSISAQIWATVTTSVDPVERADARRRRRRPTASSLSYLKQQIGLSVGMQRSGQNYPIGQVIEAGSIKLAEAGTKRNSAESNRVPVITRGRHSHQGPKACVRSGWSTVIAAQPPCTGTFQLKSRRLVPKHVRYGPAPECPVLLGNETRHGDRI